MTNTLVRNARGARRLSALKGSMAPTRDQLVGDLAYRGPRPAHGVIDIDSHFQEPMDWLDQFDPRLAQEARDAGALNLNHAQELVSELYACVLFPPEQAESFSLPDLYGPVGKKLYASMGKLPQKELQSFLTRHHERFPVSLVWPGKSYALWDMDERIEYMDAQGIDVQFVLPGVGLAWFFSTRKYAPYDIYQRTVEAYHSWAAQKLEGRTDRLMPVTWIEFDDVPWAVRELTRMRALGSRSFFFPAYAIKGRSLAHESFAPVWAAAQDLGMSPYLHIGTGKVFVDPGWCNPGRQSLFSAVRVGFSEIYQMTETVLTGLILEGFFERYPKLTFLLAENGIGWIPAWLQRLDRVVDTTEWRTANGGPWPYPLKPSEYARRHLKVTPLRGMRAEDYLQLPECRDMLVFSSDFPHPEGSHTAHTDYESAFAGKVDRTTADDFFGGHLARILRDGVVA